MKKFTKVLSIVLTICLLASFTPVLAATGSVSETLYYQNITITLDDQAITPTDDTGRAVDPFIIDGTVYLPVRAISEAFGYAVDWDDDTSAVTINTNAQTSVSHTLMAGAGIGTINFSAEVLQGSGEGFSGEYYGDLHARILVLEDEITVAIVALDMVQPGSSVDALKAVVSEELGIPAGNVWIHCTHTTTTPHSPRDEALAAEWRQALVDAMKKACGSVVMQPAAMGVAKGELDINVNRNIAFPEGVDESQFRARNSSYGRGDKTLDSDKELIVVSFCSVKTGEPIGTYMSYSMKPSGLDQAGKSENARLATADVQGFACDLVEETLGGVCMFVMPAAAEQILEEPGTWNGVREDGTWGQINIDMETGKANIAKYGEIMGNAVIDLAKSIDADITDADIQIVSTAFEGLDTDGASPKSVDLDLITLGSSVALVGIKPEINALTGKQLKNASPYETTLAVSFMNGDAKYMPDDAAYDFNGFGSQEAQSGSAAYGRGTAEKLVSTSVELLTGMKNNGGKTGTENATLYYRDINIVIDGKTITPTDVDGNVVEPFIIDGTTYLPVRAVSEAMGCGVDWDGQTNTVIITSGPAVQKAG